MKNKAKGGGEVNYVDIQRKDYYRPRKQRIQMHTGGVGWNVQGLLSETTGENSNNVKEVPKDLVASEKSFVFIQSKIRSNWKVMSRLT